ncbi:MAG: hypothetical protein A2754_00550 [Candidatus Magasanikbacteria bacterium RIFCSPHIGHO2_01_FULL_47_8]|uniref:Cell division protein FtsX n=1 Tax=Candidatus Magasanikbacteria bacterium RIFCSPHIGHO2_01_FULL_47_8 TaxID=1798673 RepID=A0A1F6MCF6_9BACT|nr:MAG: hypothetical protein A2754_00550 [Candidatus Magasanikbacteria bacterium RIFCSPHIGHO2_01_FULL_47_8]
MSSLFRIFKFAFQDLARNLGLSSMTVFILILMLLSINTLWSLDILTKESVRLVKQQINVSFYLTPETTEKNVKEIKAYLATFPEVEEAEVLTREQVLSSFKTRHQLSTEVLQALAELGGNPFGPTIVVKTKEPEDYKKVIQALSVPEYEKLIEGKSFEGHEEALDRIQAITNRVEKVGLGVTLLFALISFLIIFNTIRVAIHTQRVEISIKRLVGANNWFIRGPYLVESLIFTVVSMSVTIVIVMFVTKWLDRYLSVAFPTNFSLTNYYESHMLYLFGIQTLAVLLLTTLSSILAMRRQLKV